MAMITDCAGMRIYARITDLFERGLVGGGDWCAEVEDPKGRRTCRPLAALRAAGRTLTLAQAERMHRPQARSQNWRS